MNKASALSPEQLHYLSSVLGIQSFVMPKAMPQCEVPLFELSEPIQKTVHKETRLVAFFPMDAADFPLKGEAAELVTKMIRAMKLAPTDVLSAEWLHSPIAELPKQILELFIQARNASCPVVIFGFEEARDFMGKGLKLGEWTEMSGARVLATHSPQELLKSPERKKNAWLHLQCVMGELR